MPVLAVKILKSLWDRSSSLLIFLFLFIGFSLFVPHFFSLINLAGLALSISMVGMVSCSMLFCLASKAFDLSVESVVAFSGIVVAVAINASGSVLLGIVCAVVAGGLIGFANGLVIAKFRMNALITTLASMQIVRGLAFIVSDGSAVSIYKPEFFVFGSGTVFGIPNPVIITVVIFVFFGLLFNNTSFGKNTLAIGGNEDAARLSGINVSRTRIIIFTLQGLVAGFAGVVLASRMASGQPNTSSGFSLDVISACVLGGVSLSGGSGSITGIIVGVLIMGSAQNAMNLVNIPTFYQYVLRGLILLLAVLLDRLKHRFNFRRKSNGDSA
ncbi:MAG: L-arabinose ABC transporter permease AraH [Spirochaetales bacterium]|nr:L-arabinose ABC transporter permease AraH [Spirochaetales bacterium]